MSKAAIDAEADKRPATIISPSKLAHVVLRTRSNFDAMVEWYCVVLGAQIVFNAGGRLIFLSYDDEHHRIAIAASEALAERPRAPPAWITLLSPMRISMPC
jgi:catechol-2,3-dioxygenase